MQNRFHAPMIRRQVQRARRRLIIRSLADKLARCSLVALSAAAVAVVAGKIWPVMDDRTWAIAWAVGALAAAATAAAGWTWSTRPSLLAAAGEIDRCFALAERVSSAWALDPEQSQTAAGQALARDAERRVARIDIAAGLPLRIDRRALPLLPAAALLALALLVSPRAPAPVAARVASDQLRKPARELAGQIELHRRQAVDAGLADAAGLLGRWQQGAKELAEKPRLDRKETLIALNDLAEEAEKRRQALAGGAELKRQLARLQRLTDGPAEKLGRALKEGDFEQAAQELDRLGRQVADGQLDRQAAESLARQFDGLSRDLKPSATRNERAATARAVATLAERIDKERHAGNQAAAERLQRQLETLARAAPQAERLDKLAQQLSTAAARLGQEGSAQQAAESLGRLSGEMHTARRDLQELDVLEGALGQMADCRSAMACQQCNGEGCSACRPGANRLADAASPREEQPGRGVGPGQEPATRIDAGYYDSRVGATAGKGTLVVAGQADGPAAKSQALEQIKAQYRDVEQRSAEAPSAQRLPRAYRDHAQEYFDTLGERRQ